MTRLKTYTDRDASLCLKVWPGRAYRWAEAGDIVGLTGVDEGNIGQTVAALGDLESLPAISISEPTLHVDIGPNTSPFAGRDGKPSTSRQLEERLVRELETNLSLRLEKLPTHGSCACRARASCTCPFCSKRCAVRGTSLRCRGRRSSPRSLTTCCKSRTKR